MSSLVVIVAVVALIGSLSLTRSNTELGHLYDHNLRVIQVEADLAHAVHDLDTSADLLAQAAGPERRSAIVYEQDNVLLPHVSSLRGELARLQRREPDRMVAVGAIGAGIDRYVDIRERGSGTLSSAALTRRADRIFEDVSTRIDELRAAEYVEVTGSKQAADAAYRQARLLLAGSVAFSLLVAGAVVLLLSRNMVPRIRRYSRFATEIAAGRSTGHLVVSGSDELGVLGTALNEMTAQRHLLDRREHRQAEFVDALQVTSSEQEAHELIERHVHRSLPGSRAVILQRNNSANRLQPATALAEDSDLVGRLEGAVPRSCLAVRFGRPHHEGPAVDPLLACDLCTGHDDTSVCEPLLVGGQVIGSVLVSQPDPLADEQQTHIRTTVGQAAPVLANLRSLALAEFRANNDSLTGLPNKRATDDTVKRMVAQASRSITPLTAVMLDLDHFKQINDQFGHGKGDEVLAAVGATLSGCLRASDFAGRFGGEEFLVLLPDTGTEGALEVAEKMRLSVASITVPGVDRPITISCGIADLLEHAGNSTALIREADRALYGAKAAGRNRTALAEVRGGSGSSSEPATTTAPRDAG